MKSKISFFNKTIFLKNVTLYWPIWVVYTLVLLVAMPFNLWLSVHDRYDITPITDERMIREIYWVLQPELYISIIAFTALIVGMALFSYLYKSQSANMIHSLPVDRTQLFGTNVISGLAFLTIPQIFTFVVTILVCLTEGITRVEYIAMWLLFAMVTAFIAFSIVTICAFLTGQLVAMPVYVVIANFLAYPLMFFVDIIVRWYGYGVEVNFLSQDVLIWFMPLVNYLTNVQVSYVRDITDTIVGIQMSGIPCIIIYFLVAIGLYALAYFVYRIRKIEHAGELITVEILKPIFRWGVGTLCGFYVALFFATLFGDVGYGFSRFSFMIGFLFLGALFYFVADMFVRKSFRVFRKRNWKGCGLFCLALIATVAGLAGYANIEEKYVPQREQVLSANVNMGYYAEYEGAAVDMIVHIHKLILENLDYYESMDDSVFYGDYNAEQIYIEYIMKDGREIRRRYDVPYEGDGIEIIDTIRELEAEPHAFLSYLLGDDYDNVENLTFSYGYINIQKLVSMGTAGYKVEDLQKELTFSQSRKLYEAIIADGLEGRLNKYNSHYVVNDEEVRGRTYHIHMEVTHLAPQNARGAMTEEYQKYNYINVEFGEDCKNIINAIVELGIEGIDSPDDVFWSRW